MTLPTTMKQLCLKCGNKLGTKQPDEGTTWWAGVCGRCGKKGYVTAPRDFGIIEEDETVKKLKKLFNIK